MKFQPDEAEGVNAITRHEPQRIWVGNTPYEASVLVPWVGDVLPWDVGAPDELTPGHFERCLALKPALVIFGSGPKLQFVKPALYRALIEQRIGFETMDTAAACRTYNVLASEGRAVVAALIIPRWGGHPGSPGRTLYNREVFAAEGSLPLRGARFGPQPAHDTSRQ